MANRNHDPKKTHEIALSGLLFALAMALSFIEGTLVIPGLAPGMKLGLANIVVMYALFFMGARQALYLDLLKALFVFLVSGWTAGFLSLCGGLLSLLVMWVLYYKLPFRPTWFILSVCGALSHNIGQLLGAGLILSSAMSLYYAPVMLVLGLVMGALTSLTLRAILPALGRLTLGLSHRKYILAVGRFVKEKEFDKLIMAFSDLNLQDYHLVIAGDSDHKTSYSTYLKELARKKQVILTGMVKGESLKELYSHAGLFVLPSSHEGLPITLLEAMSYNIDTLVSDIPANLAVGLSKEHYFKVNHMNSLKQQLTYKIYQNNYPVYYDLKAYNWDHIAQQTFNVYNNLLNV